MSIWFTSHSHGIVGRLKNKKIDKTYNLNFNKNISAPIGICSDKENRIWFTLKAYGGIGFIENDNVSIIDLPKGSMPRSICCSTEGTTWFTDQKNGSIGIIKNKKIVDILNIKNKNSEPIEISCIDDNNVWFVQKIGNKICKIDKTKTIFEYEIKEEYSEPFGIFIESFDKIWYTQKDSCKIKMVNELGIEKNSFNLYNTNNFKASDFYSTLDPQLREISRNQEAKPTSICINDSGIWVSMFHKNSIINIFEGKIKEMKLSNRHSFPYKLIDIGNGMVAFSQFNSPNLGIIKEFGLYEDIFIGLNTANIAYVP